MSDINRPRPFLEQRGEGIITHHGQPPLCYLPIGRSHPFTCSIDLDDSWPVLTCAADMVSLLKHQRDGHERNWKRENQRYMTRIDWGLPQIVWYYLGSGNAFALGRDHYEKWVTEFNAAGSPK